jgi:hypothetical protein
MEAIRRTASGGRSHTPAKNRISESRYSPQMRSADQERNEAWRDLVCRWKPLFWAEERGQIVSGIGPYLQRRAIERKAYTAREQFVSRGDKATRAQSFRGRMAMLGLYVPTRAPWYPELRAELLSFPPANFVPETVRYVATERSA